MHRYLCQTALLDFQHPSIRALVERRGWRSLSGFDRVGAAYTFVRDEVEFGYNRADDLPASEVLSDGIGQCNTKATLLMALFRALDLPCRLRGFTIDKRLQRGVVPELIYPLAPDDILHSWVEVLLDDRWLRLEGFIVDLPMLSALQLAFGDQSDSLCGYGVGTDSLNDPGVDWTGVDTFIQKTAINNDFGLFDAPDDFYKVHQQAFSPVVRQLYSLVLRHWMNRRVQGVRSGRSIPRIPGLSKGSRRANPLTAAAEGR